MALFPQSFLDDLKTQTDIVSIVNEVDAAEEGGRDLEGTVSVSSGEISVVHGQPRQGSVPLLRLRRRWRRRQVRAALSEDPRSRTPSVTWRSGRACRCPNWKAARTTGRPPLSARRWWRCTKTRWCSSRSSWPRRPEPEPGVSWRRRMVSTETMATFRYGYAPAGGRDTLRGPVRVKQGAARAPASERPHPGARWRATGRPVSTPPDDSDCPGLGFGRGLWRAGPG